MNIQQEAFHRRLGHCVKVVRLEDNTLAVLDQYDLVRHYVIAAGDHLWNSIHDVLDNPTIHQPFRARPNPVRQADADDFLRKLGLG